TRWRSRRWRRCARHRTWPATSGSPPPSASTSTRPSATRRSCASGCTRTTRRRRSSRTCSARSAARASSCSPSSTRIRPASSPRALKDAALKLGGLNWGGFFAAQRDTPAKLAAFAYAFEHLEIGAYELLRRVAERDGDAETAAMAETILAQERAAAEKVHGS